MNPTRDQHEVDHEHCAVVSHCHTHYVDEPDDRRFVICPECNHVYRRAASMWRAYVREHFKLFRRDMRHPLLPPALDKDDLFALIPEEMHHWSFRWPRVAAALTMARAPFTRPSKIGFCQECIHDL